MALLLAALASCGGSEGGVTPPLVTPLPDSVALAGPSRAETGESIRWTSTLKALQPGWTVDWDFGDGARSSELEPSHGYSRGGDYTVTLTVSNGSNERRVTSSRVQIGAFARVQGLVCGGAAGSGWCWQQPQAPASDVLGAQFLDARVAVAVGERNSILRTADGGLTWSMQGPSAPSSGEVDAAMSIAGRLERVRFVDSQVGVATASFPGRMLRTDDGGITWQTLAPPPLWWIRRVWLIDRQTVVLSGFDRPADRFGYGLPEGSTSLISEDGGNTWRQAALLVAEVTAGPTLWSPAGSFSGQMRVSRDLGRSAQETPTCCTSVSSGTVRSSRIDDIDLVIRSEDIRSEVIQRSTDRGLSWQVAHVQPPTAGQRLKGVGFRSATEAWASFEHSFVDAQGVTQLQWQRAISTDGGNQWTAQGAPINGTAPFSAALRLDQTGWVIAGDSPQAWTFNDGEAAIRPLTLPESGRFLRSISRQGDTMRAGFGAVGRYPDASTTDPEAVPPDRWYLSTDAGVRWSLVPGGQPGGAQAAISGLWFFDKNQGLAVDAGGALLRTADGGRSWQRNLPAPSFPARQLQFTADVTGWGRADNGLWRSTDRGTTWQRVSTPDGAVESSFALDARRVWVTVRTCRDVTDSSTCSRALHATTDGGAAWAQLSTPEQFNPRDLPYSFHFTSELRGIALSFGGNWFTRDGGRTWTAAAGVAAPNHACDRKTRFVGEQHGWFLCTGVIGPRGGVASVVLRTVDGGQTWSAVRNLPSGAGLLNDLAFGDANNGWLVGANGLLLASRDGGDTWQVQSSDTTRDLSAVAAVDAVTAWLGGDRGTVLATATGGR